MSEYTNLNPSGHTLFDIARLNIEEATAVNIFGYNPMVETAYETLWNYGGKISRPVSAVAMTAVSDSASDTSKQILISGLDALYEPITEIITLNGTTPVSGSVQFLRINSVIWLDSENIGNISVSNGGTVYGYIGAGEGISQACSYTVPADHSLYLFRITLNSATANPNKYIRIRNVTRSSTGRVLRVARATSSVSQVQYDRQVPFRINEKTDFEFEAQSSSGDNEVAIFVEAVLLKNPWGRP